MKFDLVNLQQRVKKSFDPMRLITAEFISSQPAPNHPPAECSQSVTPGSVERDKVGH